MVAKRRKKRKIEGTFIRVTTSELYLFEPSYSNGWSIETVIENWFNNFPINSCHVSRDGGRVGNSKNIVNIEIIDEKNLNKITIRQEQMKFNRASVACNRMGFFFNRIAGFFHKLEWKLTRFN